MVLVSCFWILKLWYVICVDDCWVNNVLCLVTFPRWQDGIRYQVFSPRRQSLTRPEHHYMISSLFWRYEVIYHINLVNFDYSITSSTRKMLVSRATLTISRLPRMNPPAKRTNQNLEKSTHFFCISLQSLLSIISGTGSRLSASSIAKLLRRHRIAIVSKASTPRPISFLECRAGGTPTALWRKSWMLEEIGREGVEMMVSFQDKPELVSWYCIELRAMVTVCCSRKECWDGAVKEVLPCWTGDS